MPVNSDWPNVIVHADLDAFYASAETLDNPSLADLPLVVGPRSNRGVVLTANYVARRYGIQSAMPMAEALQRCPDLVAVPPRFERYQALSEQMMAVFRNFSPDVEAVSLDEAFLDLTGATNLLGEPAAIGSAIKREVTKQTGGLTISVGVSSTKFVAKVASGYRKPDSLTVVPPTEAVAWLDPMPVSKLWGAGPKTTRKFEQIGLYTIGDVRRADAEWLTRMLGSQATNFQHLANARDIRVVHSNRVSRSMGSDRTLSRDVSSRQQLSEHLRRSAERLGSRLRSKSLLAGGVRVRLKTSDFELLSRQTTLTRPIDITDVLWRTATSLLDRFEQGQTYRLVGMAVFDMQPASEPVQNDLFETKAVDSKLDRVIDAVEDKYGAGSLIRASRLSDKSTIIDQSVNLDSVDEILSDEE